MFFFQMYLTFDVRPRRAGTWCRWPCVFSLQSWQRQWASEGGVFLSHSSFILVVLARTPPFLSQRPLFLEALLQIVS